MRREKDAGLRLWKLQGWFSKNIDRSHVMSSQPEQIPVSKLTSQLVDCQHCHQKVEFKKLPFHEAICREARQSTTYNRQRTDIFSNLGSMFT